MHSDRLETCVHLAELCPVENDSVRLVAKQSGCLRRGHHALPDSAGAEDEEGTGLLGRRRERLMDACVDCFNLVLLEIAHQLLMQVLGNLTLDHPETVRLCATLHANLFREGEAG